MKHEIEVGKLVVFIIGEETRDVLGREEGRDDILWSFTAEERANNVDVRVERIHGERLNAKASERGKC